MPKLSIITTAFNDEKYLKNCIDHLIKQTFKDIEIIIVDDASKDKTPSIISEYAKKDPRIKPIILEQNMGPSAARNAGLDAAAGQYVMFCDGDDYYDYTMCEKMYTAIDKTGVDFAACEIHVVYEAHREMKSSDDSYYELNFGGRRAMEPAIIQSLDSSVDNKIFRKSLIDKYHMRFPEGLKYEDTMFVALYCYASDSVYFINEKLYYYTRRDNSIMSQTWTKEAKKEFSIDFIRVFVKLHEYLAKEKLFHNDEYYEVFWHIVVTLIYSAHFWCKTEEAREEIREVAKNFVNSNWDEISEHVTESTQKYLKKYTSPTFFTKRWLVLDKMKKKYNGVKNILSGLFRKIFTSQCWATTKLRRLSVDTDSLRADINLIRKTH